MLNTEVVVLTNRRKIIGVELVANAERVSDNETAAVTLVLCPNGVDLEQLPPVAMSMLLTQRCAVCATKVPWARFIGQFRADQSISCAAYFSMLPASTVKVRPVT